MRRLWVRGLLFVVLILSLSIHFVSAQPVQPPLPLPTQQAQPFRQPVLPLYQTSNKTDFNNLLNIAHINGTVRVIVRLQTLNLRGMTDTMRTQSIRSTQQTLLTSLAGQNVTVVRQFNYVPYMTVRVDAAALQAVRQSPLVASIRLDGLLTLSLATSAAQIGAKGAAGAWELGYTGAGQTVAVIDSGVDKTHPAFGSRVVSEACYSGSLLPTDFPEGAVYTVTSTCPGGASSSTAPGSGLDCDEAYSGCYHGTHVAGIVASNDPTNRGIAPEANIIALQVFTYIDGSDICEPEFDSITKCIISSDTDYAAALERVYELRNTYDIAAVNMSLGGGSYSDQSVCDAESELGKDAVDLLKSVDIATIAASGNSGTTNQMGTPGCISSAISVGSVNREDGVSLFSNSTPFLTLLAPGGECIELLGLCFFQEYGINSTMPDNTFAEVAGTSMAAPHVAGAWALMKQAEPDLTVNQVRDALANTGKPVADDRTGAGNRVKPRIQVDEALLSIGAQPPTPTHTPNGSESPTPTLSSSETPTATLPGSETPTATLSGSETPTSTPGSGETPTATPAIGDDLLVNGDFEATDDIDQPDMLPWTDKNLTGDKIKCNKDTNKVFAYEGNCAFMFKGSVGENSSIQQTIASDAVVIGDRATLSGYVKTKGAVNTTVKIRVKYVDTSLAKGKITIKQIAPTVDYVALEGELSIMIAGEVSSFKVKVQNGGTSGKAFYDALSLTRSSIGLLPLPQ